MQGILLTPHNLHTGSSPPQHTIENDVSMDIPQKPPTKETDQSTRSDSGIFSATTNSTLPDDQLMDSTQNSSDSDCRSDCSSPENRYVCPICKTALSSQHAFTLHIRSHNGSPDAQETVDKGFTCSICKKVLSSGSSLDRHVLVHSGERPFTCRHCGDKFTTNGNMHRHMRTHKNEHYESDCSSDSNTSNGNKNVEFNNNKVELKADNKRKWESLEPETCNKLPRIQNEIVETYKCPVCERTDFNSVRSFETHFEDNHPDYPVKCGQCNLVFQSSRSLGLHKNVSHPSDETARIPKTSVTGFKDLTFVDFSSNKFPYIARYECEKNLHKATAGLKFQCSKCARAFPCANSLEIHERDCSPGLDLRVKGEMAAFKESDIRRDNFFASLDLQNKVSEKNGYCLDTPSKLHQHILNSTVKKSIDSTKDLADIQSIISMTTNGSLLHQLNHKPFETPREPHDTTKNEEEEAQDVFATEFRKMKLRGEFPCRLCTAVFPNLRALKGHNRTHLNGTNNGTYRCNMCPHSSLDKAALIRHMRTHNGDRPYECALCNYAFTTKANCERHLRNRHAKNTREEVKKSIIYHPSADPTNDDVKMNLREESKKSNSSVDDLSPEKLRSSTPKMPILLPETLNSLSIPNKFRENSCDIPDVTEMIHKENLKSLKEHRIEKPDLIPPFIPQFNFSPKTSNVSTPSKIQVRSVEALRDNDSDSNSENEDCNDSFEHPMDMVLDLSKKKPVDNVSEGKSTDLPEDLSKRSAGAGGVNMGEILAQQLMNNTPKIDPSSFYATLLCRSGLAVPNWPGFNINHLLYPALQNPFLVPDQQELRERVQRYQLCGGGMISDNFVAERIKTLQGLSQNLNGLKLAEPKSEYISPPKPEKTKSPLLLEQNYPETLLKVQSPLPSSVKQEMIHSPNSVKMVIKNGVLMPKQKQRRYRTERPFSCEHCSARFTLRSNMERHIKQQHPQFWSQRQRSNISHPGRKSQTFTGNLKFCDLTVPSYEAPKIEECDEAKEHVNEKLRYAILANHLRSVQGLKMNDAIKREEDEGSDLVIDENDDVNKDAKVDASEAMEEKWKPLSLKVNKPEEAQDLVPVSRLLDNASQQQFKEYFRREQETEGISEEDEEGLVASGSTSEGNNSGTDENRSESGSTPAPNAIKKKSAYSLAPNRVSCPYCNRKFPWTSSLRRHILTHTGQKPFKCSHCPLLFTTKSNCDRHLLRKHGNSATTMSNDSSNTNYMMRNVPERPFKCSNCPSSTFSTYSNLKKHISCKHSNNEGEDAKAQGYEAGSSEDEKGTSGMDQKKEWENQISHSKASLNNNESQTVQFPNSDLPYKCHLCDKSFGERQNALDHIKDEHSPDYELLMSKNALDTSVNTPEEATSHDMDDEHDARGKFPDYSNRKVICAFCMRRFWSAEDLRRHMRTHTGERPFSCDICRRRFTLKHSMLRHRKKHNLAVENDNGNSDEDGNLVEKYAPKLEEVKKEERKGTDESDGNEGDLISNLLGLRDKSMLDQVLTASADDAAKLLGVKNGNPE